MAGSKINFGIVAKPSHVQAKELAEQLIKHFQERNVSYLLDFETAKELELSSSPGLSPVPREEMSTKCSHIVVLGGDGTLISVCRHPSERPPVIIGVNLGTLGFLTEITAEEMLSVVDSTLEGSAKLESRSILEAEVIQSGSKTTTYTAVNDLVISKDTLARIFPVELSVDDEFAALVRGDGIIVATPGGSTAYSLAAGGSIVHPQVGGILLTPICPHSLTSRPLVVPANSQICLTVLADSDDFSVYLTLDGQQGVPLNSGDKICVTTCRNSLFFAKSPSKNYYEVLGAKLKWANR